MLLAMVWSILSCSTAGSRLTSLYLWLLRLRAFLAMGWSMCTRASGLREYCSLRHYLDVSFFRDSRVLLVVGWHPCTCVSRVRVREHSSPWIDLDLWVDMYLCFRNHVSTVLCGLTQMYSCFRGPGVLLADIQRDLSGQWGHPDDVSAVRTHEVGTVFVTWLLRWVLGGCSASTGREVFWKENLPPGDSRHRPAQPTTLSQGPPRIPPGLLQVH